MGVERFFVHELTVRRWPTKLDRYNNTVRDRTATPADTIVFGWLGPSETVEHLIDGRVEERIARRCRMPIGTDVTADDQVLFGDELYEVDGVPFDTPVPTGRPAHVRVNLLSVEG